MRSDIDGVAADASFTRRFSRQLALPCVGLDGQYKLSRSSVLVIGAGGLGSPVLLYLAAAGIGRIGIVDHDTVDLSNLQRQVLYGPADIGLSKAGQASRLLSSMAPGLEVKTFLRRFDDTFPPGELEQFDVVVDAVDNPETKLTIARLCATTSRRLVSGGIRGFEGQVMSVVPGHTACPGCLSATGGFPPDAAAPPAGPMGALPGIVGSIQALEVLKLILGIGAPLFDNCLFVDGLRGVFRKFRVSRKDDCPVCRT